METGQKAWRAPGPSPPLSADPSRRADVGNGASAGAPHFLFGPPGAGGLDLVALNLQRGRDHGLADFATVRTDYGLPPSARFSDITSDTAVAAQLETLHGTIDDIDAFAGMLAEIHVDDAMVGKTMIAILVDQFTRLRAGDRF